MSLIVYLSQNVGNINHLEVRDALISMLELNILFFLLLKTNCLLSTLLFKKKNVELKEL